MQSLCVVHYSDLHLKQESQFNQKSMLVKMIEDTEKELVSQDLGKPFVAISGDLACFGKQKEYEYVEKFIGILKDRLNPIEMIFSPGNHDLNWDEYGQTCNNELMENLIKQPGPETVERIERRFQKRNKEFFKVGMSNYYSFLERVGQDYNPDYLYTLKDMDLERVRVNFVSLNSAYLFSRDCKDFGYIGKTQIDKAFEELQEKLTDKLSPFNVAIFHHPFESIAPASEVDTERLLKNRCSLFLNGHVHNLKVYSDLTANLTGESKGRPLVSCARCAIDQDEDPYVTPGYSLMRIDFNENKMNSIAIYERKYDKLHREWISENQLEYPIMVGDYSCAPKPKMLNTELDMYKEGIRIANSQAHKHLIIYQRTPSLLLGAKPYGDTEKFEYEEEYIKCLENKIQMCINKPKVRLWYLFDLEKTKKILEAHPYLANYANKALDELKKKEKESKLHFRFEPVPFKFLGPLMIGDLGYMVWIGSRDIGREILVLSSNQSTETNEMIDRLVDRFALQQTTAQQLRTALGLNKTN